MIHSISILRFFSNVLFCLWRHSSTAQRSSINQSATNTAHKKSSIVVVITSERRQRREPNRTIVMVLDHPLQQLPVCRIELSSSISIISSACSVTAMSIMPSPLTSAKSRTRLSKRLAIRSDRDARVESSSADSDRIWLAVSLPNV